MIIFIGLLFPISLITSLYNVAHSIVYTLFFDSLKQGEGLSRDEEKGGKSREMEGLDAKASK